MDDCKSKLEKIAKEVDETKKMIDELGTDIPFFIKNRDKIRNVLDIIERDFSEARECPIPAVKVDGVCKDTSLILEPVVGLYVPSEDIFWEIKSLIDAGSISKLKDKLSELKGYLDSVVGGYTCEIPNTEKSQNHDDAPVPLFLNKEEKKEEKEEKSIPTSIEAEAEIAVQEGEYMKLAKKKPRNETSKRRQWYKECMSEKLKGKKKGMSRVEWREFFRKAAEECKNENPYPKKS